MSSGARPQGRHAGHRAPFSAAAAAGALLDLPRRFVGALVDELSWLVILLPLWGLSLLAWHFSPWLLGALVATVAGWTAWSLDRARTSPLTVLGIITGLALLQLAPVLLVTVL